MLDAMTDGGNTFPQELELIRADRVHGATFLAQRAIWALARVAAGNDTADRSVDAAAVELAAAKPYMASIGNGVGLLLARLRESNWDHARALALASELIAEVQQKTEEAARQAAALLPFGSLVLTCSYSVTVTHAIVAASQMGKRVTARALPSAGYGRLMAAEARSLGVDMEVTSTLPKRGAAGNAVGLIGADAVTGSTVINGAPSLGLARWCFDRQLPFYVVCDSLKLSDRPLVGSTALPQGMQRIPIRYVTTVITEAGT